MPGKLFLLYLILLFVLSMTPVWADSVEKEISLADLDERSVGLDNLHPLRLNGQTHDDPALQTHITGYAVASYRYNDSGVDHEGLGNELHFGQDPAQTGEFAFNLIEVGFTKRFSSWAWVSAAIEVGLHREDTGEQSAEIELDQGAINLVAPIGNGLIFTAGKFNSPVSFEQEDAPLLLQASHSLTFQFASPAKMSGLMVTYPFSEIIELRAVVFNGWESDGDNNDAKSFALQLGYAPWHGLSTKFSYLLGAELEDNDSDVRHVLDFAATITPFKDWLLGLELAYGWDENQSTVSPGSDAEWWSGQATLHYDFTSWFGTTLRYSFFKDQDGRPDIHDPQKRTMNEFTVAPVFHISPDLLGFLGMGVIPHSEHLVSGIDLRLEYRYDWIDEDGPEHFFKHENAALFTDERNMFIAELVASF